MNRLYLMIVCLILVMPQAWGYPNPYRKTMWNNMTDDLHTMGQSPRQAADTKMKLQNQRVETRLNDIRRAKRQAWLNAH